ncbi:hypothetical protein [Corynebacterium marquesiae]|uniref:hypothetical protein n=1 Tax=Corynebacterium marquesiae TaxID=2913503 RepID=UPI0022BA4394|nr:hypothetical protein [Corynebacterium marquesiae]MCZ9301475.1 hypothetical protein [Corynebacterium marquesiae]
MASWSLGGRVRGLSESDLVALGAAPVNATVFLPHHTYFGHTSSTKKQRTAVEAARRRGHGLVTLQLDDYAELLKGNPEKDGEEFIVRTTSGATMTGSQLVERFTGQGNHRGGQLRTRPARCLPLPALHHRQAASRLGGGESLLHLRGLQGSL